MIKSYEDYLYYLKSDQSVRNQKITLRTYIYNDVWKFQRLLRKLEYLSNCKKNKLRRMFVAYRFMRIRVKLGFMIPINVFGPGLSIAHYGSIIITSLAKIGKNCRVHVGVVIAKDRWTAVAPRIGNNCNIGPGAKIFGDIVLGNKIRIGANAVVNKSFPDDNLLLVGVPATAVPVRP
ncbi:MAG: serine acetyltransferase [Desulfobacteraceae bacterium]|nr:serine acetyltransferase [Desulfobacteraceae bacterium]MBC2757653.1 serine acetyltransferase [Desulfobacteraceae bacterium]MBC2763898.1 serine acetyltransferase [ANME-2 cluster archaeon]